MLKRSKFLFDNLSSKLRGCRVLEILWPCRPVTFCFFVLLDFFFFYWIFLFLFYSIFLRVVFHWYNFKVETLISTRELERHFELHSLWFKGLKLSSKIDENFANYTFKIKANNKFFIVLKCTCKGLQKSISELER